MATTEASSTHKETANTTPIVHPSSKPLIGRDEHICTLAGQVAEEKFHVMWKLYGGGSGGGDGDGRLAKLETEVSAIRSEVAVIKSNMLTRADFERQIGELKVTIEQAPRVALKWLGAILGIILALATAIFTGLRTFG